MTGPLTRRRLLAATVAAAATGLAGCGYRPAGGELDWTATATDPGAFGASSRAEEWRSDGELLYRLRNFEGEAFTIDGWVEVDEARVAAYDADGDLAWSGVADRQYRGRPAVAGGRAYLPLEDGSVTAIERDESSDDGPGRSDSDDAGVAWAERWRGGSAPHELAAGDDLVVATDGDLVVGFGAASGEERFALERESLDLAAVDGVAVAGDRTWLRGGGELRGIDADGSVRVERSLPSAGGWLDAIDAGAILAADGEVLVVDAGGDLALSVAVDGIRNAPVVVEEAERAYHYGDGTLAAVDVAAGEVAWTTEAYSFRGDPVADADGVYGRGTGPGTDRCGLVGLTSAGEEWWDVPPLEELGCSGTTYLLEDRLVVRDGTELYGFRTRPGSRNTVV